MEAQCLRMWLGRRSGPVALVTSSDLSMLCVQRVRSSVKVDIVGSVLRGVRGGGVLSALKFSLKVFAKRFAFRVASWVQVPCSSSSGGMVDRVVALLRSSRLIDHHCLEFLGSVLSLLRSFFL